MIIETITNIPLNKINTAGRVRQSYKTDAMNALKTSITESGLLHPILVMAYPETYSGFDYYLIAGGRRFRAYQELELETIPANVTTEALDGHQIRLSELTENLQREPFTWDEEVLLKAQVHELYVKKYGQKTSSSPTAKGHSVPDSAKIFNETPQNFNADLKLAELLKANPKLADKFENKTVAKRKVKLAEKRVQLEATIDNRKQNKSTKKEAELLERSYIVKDFFDFVIDANNTFHLINHDIDYPIDINTDTDALHKQFNADKSSGTYKTISKDDYPALMQKSIRACYKALKRDGWLIIWFGFEYYEFIKQTLLDAGFFVNHSLGYWHKGNAATRNPDLFLGRSIEPFFYARKGGSSIQQPHADIYSVPGTHHSKRRHPFEKPVFLYQQILHTFTIPGAAVYDAFAGSGNLLLAAANLKMHSVATDLSNDYKEQFRLAVHAQEYGYYK